MSNVEYCQYVDASWVVFCVFVYVNRCRAELNELLCACQVCVVCVHRDVGMWMVYCLCVCM